MKKIAMYSLLLAAVPIAQAQTPGEVRRATIGGAGNTSGKCTIEVRVDIAAEIDVYGDSGRLRTLSGQPATWTRMECTDPLPYNMTDFRFRGIDGRGNVTLAQDPRNNNSMAVIRIEDSRGGAGAYTFEIEWSGASGGSPTNGFATGWGSPAAATTSEPATAPRRSGTPGLWGSGRRIGISAERGLDLCRAEVHARGERDYGLREIDVTSVAMDTTRGRRDQVSGTFNDESGGPRRTVAYRFTCQLDSASGQVTSVAFLRADGSAVPPLSQSTPASSTYGRAGYDQNSAFRACQDAVVARTNRDGYQNVVFGATAIDNTRSDWITGSLTASRGPVTDSFAFGCQMDLRNSTVRSVELNRR